MRSHVWLPNSSYACLNAYLDYTDAGGAAAQCGWLVVIDTNHSKWENNTDD